jgi:uncharacterized protein YbaR (Trm112 family)
MTLSPDLIQILVCPATRTPLRYDMQRQLLVSDEASLAYPVRDGVPLLLIEEAQQVEGGESDSGG